MPHRCRRLLLQLPILALALSAMPLSAQTPASPAPPTGAIAAASPDGGATVWMTAVQPSEVWAAGAGEAPRLLRAGQLEHIAGPFWAPDGHSFALLIEPAGTQTAGLGRWHTYAPGVDETLQIAQAAPAWVPAAISAHAAEPVAPPEDSPPLAPASRAALTPPPDVRVKHTVENSKYYNGTCRPGVPLDQVDTIPFEEYLKRVLPYEMIRSWSNGALQSGAIAARTFTWYQIIHRRPPYPDPGYDVLDSTSDHVMCDRNPAIDYTNTDTAVDQTAGRYIAGADGQPIFAQYSAENSHPTLDGSGPNLKGVLDPVGLGYSRYGHGHGLSQWGAQRWASQYGWNSTQILMHYYTAVTIVDPNNSDPLVTMLDPWPNSWLRGATGYLRAHGNVEWLSALTFSAPGWQGAGTSGSSGWTARWPLPASLSGTNSITAGGSGRTHVTPLFGVDRAVPTAGMSLPGASTMQTITLSFNAVDSGPSGVSQVAIGGDWQVGAAELARASGGGTVTLDGAAWSGRRLSFTSGITGTWQSSLTDLVPTCQKFRAYVRLRLDAPSSSTSPVARVDLIDYNAGMPLGWAEVRQGDWSASGSFQEFPIDFWVDDNYASAPNSCTPAERPVFLKVTATGAGAVSFDRIRVFRYPQSYSSTVPWGLDAREGAQTITAKVIDAAGNPSADLKGVTQWTNPGATNAWYLIRPQGWTGDPNPEVVVQVTGSLATVALQDAYLKTSTGAGVTGWSAAIRAPALTVQPLAPDRVELRYRWNDATGAANRVMFVVGAGSTSPRWPVRVGNFPRHVFMPYVLR